MYTDDINNSNYTKTLKNALISTINVINMLKDKYNDIDEKSLEYKEFGNDRKVTYIINIDDELSNSISNDEILKLKICKNNVYNQLLYKARVENKDRVEYGKINIDKVKQNIRVFIFKLRFHLNDYGINPSINYEMNSEGVKQYLTFNIDEENRIGIFITFIEKYLTFWNDKK